MRLYVYPILFYFLLNGFVICPVFSQQAFRHIEYGAYSPGFQTHFVTDYSRPPRIIGDKGRVLQINIWYPAKKNSKQERMDLNKYILLSNLKDGTTSWSNQESAILEFLKYPLIDGADSVAWRSFLSSVKPMKALKNAKMGSGNFPMAILIHGNAAEYSLMAEYLATHGFILVNVPTTGYLKQSLDVNSIGLETQIRDHEFAIDFLKKKFDILPEKIAAIGMSFGGQSALGLAIRNPLVKAVVSLDGGIGSEFGGKLLAASPFYKPGLISMPILHLYNPSDPGGTLRWFDEYKHADRLLVAYKQMIHPYFLIYGHLSNSVNYSWGKTSPIAGYNYESVLLYTHKFINESFSSLPQITSIQLEKKEQWIATGLDSVVFKKGNPIITGATRK